MPGNRSLERAVRCPRCGAALAESAYSFHRCSGFYERLTPLMWCLLALAALMAVLAVATLIPHLAKG